MIVFKKIGTEMSIDRAVYVAGRFEGYLSCKVNSVLIVELDIAIVADRRKSDENPRYSGYILGTRLPSAPIPESCP